MTKEEHENLLKEIAMTGGDTDNMLKLMQKLRDDFDEREGMLRKYGEEKDKNRPDTKGEEEKIREESREDNKEDGGLRRDPIEQDGGNGKGGEGQDGIKSSISDAMNAQDTVSRKEFDELRRKYIERFFGSGAQAIKDNDEDVRKDDEVKDMDFDDLFKAREGMQ